MKPLQFKLQLQTLAVELEGEDGEKNTYMLKELTAAERDKYMNVFSLRIGYNEAGKPCKIKNYEGLHAELLTRCMTNSQGLLVTKEDVALWPSHVAQEIYLAAQGMNHIDDVKEDGPPKD